MLFRSLVLLTAALPMDTPLANTCTEETLASGSVTTPVMVVVALTGTKAPLTGVSTPTLGGLPTAPAITSATLGEVATPPVPSVARAVRTWLPAAAGAVNRMLNGAAVSVPMDSSEHVCFQPLNLICANCCVQR